VSGGGRFSAMLDVDAAGLALQYGDIWRAEPTT